MSPTENEINSAVTRFLSGIEEEVGNDSLAYVIVMLVRISIRDNIPLDFILRAIVSGYNSYNIPELVILPVTKYDS